MTDQNKIVIIGGHGKVAPMSLRPVRRAGRR